MANMKGNKNRCKCGSFAASDGFCRNCREDAHDDERQFGTHRGTFKPSFGAKIGTPLRHPDKFPIERDRY